MPRSSHREHRTADKRNHRVQARERSGTIKMLVVLLMDRARPIISSPRASRATLSRTGLLRKSSTVAAAINSAITARGAPLSNQCACVTARVVIARGRPATAAITSGRDSYNRPREAGQRPTAVDDGGLHLTCPSSLDALRQHGAFNDVVYCFCRLLLSNSFAAARRSEDAMRDCCAVSRRGNPPSARKCATSGCLIPRSASVGRLRIGASSCPR
jgi:hypothetical protein